LYAENEDQSKDWSGDSGAVDADFPELVNQQKNRSNKSVTDSQQKQDFSVSEKEQHRSNRVTGDCKQEKGQPCFAF